MEHRIYVRLKEYGSNSERILFDEKGLRIVVDFKEGIPIGVEIHTNIYKSFFHCTTSNILWQSQEEEKNGA